MNDVDLIEQRLRRTFRVVADQYVSVERRIAPSGEQGRRNRPPRRYLRPAMSAVAIVVAVALVVLGVVAGPRSSPNGHSPARLTPSADVIALGPEIVQPSVLLASHGKLWVSGPTPSQGHASLYEYDESTGKLLSTTRLSDNSPFQIAAGDNSIWLRTQQGEQSTHLVRVDTMTHRVTANITLHFDGGLAVTPDAVWTIDGRTDGLLRIDPQTGRTVATIPLPGGQYPPLIITAGPLGVWLASSYDGSIYKVDENANALRLVAHVDSAVDQLVELGASLWVGTGTKIVEIPAITGIPGRSFDVGARIISLSTDGRWLWGTTGTEGTAFLVDPQQGAVTHLTAAARASRLLEVASDIDTGATWVAGIIPKPVLARPLVAVPNVIGISTGKAAGALEVSGLYNSIDNLNCGSTISQGRTVAESPPPGSLVVAGGTRVSLQISCSSS